MAHLAFLDPDVEYRLLQQRLDRNVTGAPDSPVFQRILRLLFTPEQARIATRIPQFISLPDLSRRTDVPVDDLDGIVTEMARDSPMSPPRKDQTSFTTKFPPRQSRNHGAGEGPPLRWGPPPVS